jgi:hypothetical protein
VTEVPAPDFAAIRQRHARAGQGYRRAAILVLVLGLLLAAAGIWLPSGPKLVLLTSGLLLAALAVLPLQAVIERCERVQGLEFLHEEWRELAAAGEGESLRELSRLLARLYRSPA